MSHNAYERSLLMLKPAVMLYCFSMCFPEDLLRLKQRGNRIYINDGLMCNFVYITEHCDAICTQDIMNTFRAITVFSVTYINVTNQWYQHCVTSSSSDAPMPNP